MDNSVTVLLVLVVFAFALWLTFMTLWLLETTSDSSCTKITSSPTSGNVAKLKFSLVGSANGPTGSINFASTVLYSAFAKSGIAYNNLPTGGESTAYFFSVDSQNNITLGDQYKGDPSATGTVSGATIGDFDSSAYLGVSFNVGSSVPDTYTLKWEETKWVPIGTKETTVDSILGFIQLGEAGNLYRLSHSRTGIISNSTIRVHKLSGVLWTEKFAYEIKAGRSINTSTIDPKNGNVTIFMRENNINKVVKVSYNSGSDTWSVADTQERFLTVEANQIQMITNTYDDKHILSAIVTGKGYLKHVPQYVSIYSDSDAKFNLLNSLNSGTPEAVSGFPDATNDLSYISIVRPTSETAGNYVIYSTKSEPFQIVSGNEGSLEGNPVLIKYSITSFSNSITFRPTIVKLSNTKVGFFGTDNNQLVMYTASI